MLFFVGKIHMRKLQTQGTKAPKQRINTFFIFSSFSFLRYGHQIADIKPFPKLTSARLFSQEPRKKLFLRRHEASLKILEDKACTCKVPIKSSLFAAFVLFISTSALSYGDEAWPPPDRFSLLAGWQYGRFFFAHFTCYQIRLLFTFKERTRKMFH